MSAGVLFAKYKGAKVLVADDEPSILELIGYILESLGLECIAANDGIEGLRKYCDHSPVIVMTDLYMPKKNGLMLAQEIQAMEPDIPIIIMTGSISENSIIFSPNIHITDVLLKPFTLTDVILAMKKALQQLEDTEKEHTAYQKNKLS